MKYAVSVMMLLASAAVAAAATDVAMFSGHHNGKVAGFERTDVSMFRALLSRWTGR